MNKDFQQLRKIFEGGDPFISRGHQVVGLRRRKRKILEWTRSNKKIQEILLRSFPRLHTNQKQRGRAARWAAVIHLYFRLQYTYRQVAEELQTTPQAVLAVTRSIVRVAGGMKANGRGKRSLKPGGRPKKLVP